MQADQLNPLNARLLYQFWSWIMLTYIMGIPWLLGYFSQLGEGWQWAFISLNLSTGLVIFYETLPFPHAMAPSTDFEREGTQLPVIGLRQEDSDEEDVEDLPEPEAVRKFSLGIMTNEGFDTAKENSSTVLSTAISIDILDVNSDEIDV